MKIITFSIFILSAGIIDTTFGQAVLSDSAKQQKFISYFFTVQTGTIVGCRDCKVGKEITFSASTIHGIKVGRKLRVGAGVGFDSYSNWQTLPLFGSVSLDLFGKNNTVFTQLNYGWARAWRPFSNQEYGFKDTNGGQSFSAMIGYRIMYGDMRLALSAGYKFQSATAYYQYSYYSWLYSNQNYETGTQQTVKENMNRLAILLSVGWK
jgi:hypothetical protein